jgi:hypothetical protein
MEQQQRWRSAKREEPLSLILFDFEFLNLGILSFVPYGSPQRPPCKYYYGSIVTTR